MAIPTISCAKRLCRLRADRCSSLLAPAAHAETVTVGSGDLRAQIETDPWSLSFVDADGREVVGESRAMPIGYRTSTRLGGRHARRVGRRATATPSSPRSRPPSTTPLGAVPGEPAARADRARRARGTIAIEVDAARARRRHGARDRVRGTARPSASTASASGPSASTTAARAGSRPTWPTAPTTRTPSAQCCRRSCRRRATATATTRRTSRSRGCSRRTATACSSRTRRRPTTTSATSGTWSLEVTTAPDDPGADQRAPASLRLRVFGGGSPAATLRRFTRHVGRQPAPAAPWVWGAWFQPGGSLEEQIGQLEKLRKADAPVSVMQTYLHYLPCGDHVGGQDAERERVDAFHARGTAVTTYFNPMICADYQPRFDEAAAAGRARDGRAAATRTRTSTRARRRAASTSASSTSRRRPAARSTSSSWPRRSPTATTAGWRTSASTRRSTRTTRTAWTARGCTTSTRRSTTAPRTTSCAAQERPIVRFQRSGFTGAARCAQVVWSGDPTVGWDFDGLESQIKAALSIGMSGDQHVGIGHRRLLRARHARAQRRAADALGPVRRRLAGDADAAQRRRVPGEGAAAGRGRRPDRELAPLREAAHAAVPVPRGGRPRVPPDGPADHAPPGARLSRTTSARSRARTSTCSGRTCWRRRCSSRARPSASCTCRRGAGSTSGARSRTSRAAATCACAARA